MSRKSSRRVKLSVARWLVALCAVCGVAADASTSSSAPAFDLTVPVGFVPAPRIAKAATQRAAKVAKGVNAAAWKHETLGCYVVLQTVTMNRSTEAKRLHRSLADSLADSGVKVKDYTFDDATATSHFAFRREALRGFAVTRSRSGGSSGVGVAVGFAACFYRPRRAKRCEALCDDILERFEKQ